MSAPELQDELSFSPAPKMVGERNPDSVLFKIGDMSEGDSKPPARGKNEIIEGDADDPIAPPPRAIETEEQERAASSGLVSVQDLLDEETEAANALPKTAINPGLIPESAPAPQVEADDVAVAPPSKMPMYMMVAGIIAVLLAVGAMLSTMN